jgi:hypothetical protein
MSEMIERVAKAIFDIEYADPRRPVPDFHPPHHLYLKAARAAIEAMRNYSPAMAQAGDGMVMSPHAYRGKGLGPQVWQAMIDEALTERPAPAQPASPDKPDTVLPLQRSS